MINKMMAASVLAAKLNVAASMLAASTVSLAYSRNTEYTLVYSMLGS